MVEKPKRVGLPEIGCCQVRSASAAIAFGELALGLRCCQQLADDGEAKVRPPLVNPSGSCLFGHAALPSFVSSDRYKA